MLDMVSTLGSLLVAGHEPLEMGKLPLSTQVAASTRTPRESQQPDGRLVRQ